MASSIRRRDVIRLAAGAVAWPLAARAQQRALPVIGYLDLSTEGGGRLLSVPFRQGLGEQGYVEGRTIEILYRWAELHRDRFPDLVADLVRRQVSVIFAGGGANTSVPILKSATASIPIVFAVANDPVESGFVASLNRPGGNVTGVSFLTGTLVPKRLELLHEIAPGVSSIGFVVDPRGAGASAQMSDATAAARILGVRLTILNAGTPSEIEEAFAILARQQIGALLVGSNALFVEQRYQFAALAARYALPAIYAIREHVEAGGLMSYGANASDAWRLAGTYVGRILKGDKPADLPVQQSTRIEMVLNLKTAKALGIEVPTATLLRATEVIE